MKTALVYDRVNKYGGAERVLLALHEMFPDAPLYTAVYDKARAKWADAFEVIPSFLNRIPLAKSNHELLALFTPYAFENFSFDDYDLVISVTSAEAKFIITKPQTIHVCYCLTPTRYLWSGYEDYIKVTGNGLINWLMPKIFRINAGVMRNWDLIGASRPDHFVAISKLVETRISEYYHRKCDRVIYPPVDDGIFRATGKSQYKRDDYFLTVSRLVGYKRLDLVIEAFNTTGDKLVIIGQGKNLGRLKQKARSNIKFITDYLTDRELVDYYKKCRAFVYGGVEDFGIVSVEAQSCGAPVIAYRGSGMAETVIEGETGELFDDLTPASLKEVIIKCRSKTYLPETCRNNARKYNINVFKKEFGDYIKSLSITK